MRTSVLAAVGVLTAVASPTAAPERLQAAAIATVRSAADDAVTYAALREIGIDTGSVVRLAGVEFGRGPARFQLGDGYWLPFEPVDGRVTGAVFLGSGRVFYDPPSGVERDQMVKFTDGEVLEEDFERLYLRFTDRTAELVAASAAAGPAVDAAAVAAKESAAAEARELHEVVREHFIDEELVNLESRILTDIADGREGFFTAWIETRERGRLHFLRDRLEPDLFTLRGTGRTDVFDQWGGFGAAQEAAARPEHYAIEMALDGGDLEGARAELRLRANLRTRVLRFDVHPYVEMSRVLDDAGRELFFTQEPAHDDLFERAVTVLFPEPLVPGSSTTITFEYGGALVDTQLGGGEYLRASTGWYPEIGYLQRATFDMTFRVDDSDKVFASGVRVADDVEGGVRVVRFEQELPVALVSYNYGSMASRDVDMEGVPPIAVFGFATGIGGDALGNVGIDIGNSLRLFSEMFGSYPFSYMAATRIPGAHGQGFPGLLHLAAASFGNESDISTAFRGHETAHQWWGHMVGWKSYRDQWISEGFAEYSGALYATAYLEDPGVLDKMTAAWRNDIFKRGNAGFRRFGMSAAAMQRSSDGSWSGPITLGRRLASSKTPFDYQMLAYEKGAYVLHMLRMAMYDWTTGSDEPFRVMMRDFVATHIGAEATTASFRAVVEKHIGEDMAWFFEQWVHGTAVPTYRYAWRVQSAIDGQRSLRIRVRQTVEPDVPFRMVVPVRLELGDERFAILRVLVDEPSEEFRFDLPEGVDPADVILNPRNAVLAEVEREGW